MKGTVTGPGTLEGKVLVLFESPGGEWNMFPNQISWKKPEEKVCLLA